METKIDTIYNLLSTTWPNASVSGTPRSVRVIVLHNLVRDLITWLLDIDVASEEIVQALTAACSDLDTKRHTDKRGINK